MEKLLKTDSNFLKIMEKGKIYTLETINIPENDEK